MKNKLTLSKISVRSTFIDYGFINPDRYDDGFICDDFVENFIPRKDGELRPDTIVLTYTDKNPKEKGFKKVRIDINNSNSYITGTVFISGKLWKRTDFFTELKNHFVNSGKPSLIYWIKIEELINK